jgi:endonuclease/exonuclease/phosphatase family metal-dependent hydrolase
LIGQIALPDRLSLARMPATMKPRPRLPLLPSVLALLLASTCAASARLERLAYHNPGLLVDLGVGLWAWPLPMDLDGDGLTDLVVVCTDVPYNGVYLFANSGGTDPATGLPVFHPGVRLGAAVDNAQVSYVDGKPLVSSPGMVYPDFQRSAFRAPVALPAPEVRAFFQEEGRIRANQWRFVDFTGNGVHDLVVGIGFWGDYGWDDAYDANGQWTRGPLRGYVYRLPNLGSDAEPRFGEPVRMRTTTGEPIEVFGRPSPSFADFTGDGKPDLICGSFLDGFTFFQNVGTRARPLFAPGRPLSNGDARIRMDLCMITPVAFDFTGNGFPDLVVGDEDGRVALIEHTGRVVDGMPLFLPPRYFRQFAHELKFGALATPVGFDWNGDGRDDILAGNTAGQIAFFANLGGNPPRWAAPVLLAADGEPIRIQAGPNGSIQGPAEENWGYTTLSVADWNHDGLPDLIVNSIWGRIVWYENIGTRADPRLAAAQPVAVAWDGPPPKPAWNWWDPQPGELVTQWRTTPVAVDWTGNGLTDLVMLDHEGYLALFRRERRGDAVVLLPGARAFRMEDAAEPLRLNDGRAGRSGRRKLAISDFDGDGRPDILVNGLNADLLRNVGEEDGVTILRAGGQLDPRRLAGHTSSPATIDLDRDGVPELLVGAEDGYFYHARNPLRGRAAADPAGTAAHPAGAAAPLRVLSYNIQHGRGIDGQIDLARIAAVINAERPDIVALQEVDKGVARTDRRDLPGELAALTGMLAYFDKNFDYQGGAYGNAVLTRLPVISARNIHLRMLRPGEQRGVIVMELAWQGRPLLFLNTHIDYRQDDAERLQNVAQFAEILAGHPDLPAVFCGDFNDRPGSRTHQQMRALLADTWEEVGDGDGFTFRADHPDRRIDYIWTSRGRVTPLRAWIPSTEASDHRPLVAELRIHD